MTKKPKKFLLSLLCICFILSICAFAENSAESTAEEKSAAQSSAFSESNENAKDNPTASSAESFRKEHREKSGDMPPRPKMPPWSESSDVPPSFDGGTSEKSRDITTQENSSQKERAENPPPEKNPPQNEADFENDMNNENQREKEEMPPSPPSFERHNLSSEDFSAEESSQSTERGITHFFKTYFTPVISMLLLALAFVFVIFYRRNIF